MQNKSVISIFSQEFKLIPYAQGLQKKSIFPAEMEFFGVRRFLIAGLKKTQLKIAPPYLISL
jgi:hypothetical protein